MMTNAKVENIQKFSVLAELIPGKSRLQNSNPCETQQQYLLMVSVITVTMYKWAFHNMSAFINFSLNGDYWELILKSWL